jgi:hypothetical protein
MARQSLPPLEPGQRYLAEEFEGFGFTRDLAAGVPPTLKLRLKGGATIEVEPAEVELRALAEILRRIYGA